MSPPREAHPAWVDGTTAAISTDLVNFSLVGGSSVQVLPCEVPIAGAYPALGIEFHESLHAQDVPPTSPEGWPALEQLDEVKRHLPGTIAQVRVWDALGEGPESAIQVILGTGSCAYCKARIPADDLGLGHRADGPSFKPSLGPAAASLACGRMRPRPVTRRRGRICQYGDDQTEENPVGYPAGSGSACNPNCA